MSKAKQDKDSHIDNERMPPIKMFVKTIAAKYERKFNVGDYESATIEVATWADIDEGQAAQPAIEELQELCKAQVRRQALPLLQGRKNGGAEYAELHDKYIQAVQIANELLNMPSDHYAKDNPPPEELIDLNFRFHELTKND